MKSKNTGMPPVNHNAQAEHDTKHHARIDRDARAKHNAFVCGFGLALAEMNRRVNQPTQAANVLDDAGFSSIEEFRRAGICEFDLDELVKCFKESKRFAKLRRQRRTATTNSAA